MAGEWLNWQQFQEANKPAEEASMNAAAERDSTQLAGLNSSLNSLESKAQAQHASVTGYDQYHDMQNAARDRQRQMQHQALTTPGWDVAKPSNYASEWQAFQGRLANDPAKMAEQEKARIAARDAAFAQRAQAAEAAKAQAAKNAASGADAAANYTHARNDINNRNRNEQSTEEQYREYGTGQSGTQAASTNGNLELRRRQMGYYTPGSPHYHDDSITAYGNGNVHYDPATGTWK